MNPLAQSAASIRSDTISLTISSETRSPRIHHRLGALADLGLGPDCRAQHVSGRELWNAVLVDQSLCLCPLPRPWRPKQYQPHLPLFPPRSFDFLISRSYWWATRWPWICATVSSVTLTTMSSEVPPMNGTPVAEMRNSGNRQTATR